MLIPFRGVNDPRRVSQDFLKRMAQEEVPGSWLGQLKDDGWRDQQYKDEGAWSYYVKGTGQQATILPPKDLREELEYLFRDQDNLALDAEWMGPRQVEEIKNRFGHHKHWFRVHDLLYWEGVWQGRVPYRQRLANLRTLLELCQAKAGMKATRIQLVQTWDHDWDKLFEEAKKDALVEGVVMKRADSLLLPNGGDNPGWLKVKYRNIHEKTAF